MECLSDFGTVSFFSVNTLTTGIYNSWLSFDDLNTANQISFILLLFIFFLFSIEIYSRKEARYHQPGRGFKPITKIKLNGKKLVLPFIVCSSILFFKLCISSISNGLLDDKISKIFSRYLNII